MIQACMKIFQKYEDFLDWNRYEKILWVCYYFSFKRRYNSNENTVAHSILLTDILTVSIP